MSVDRPYYRSSDLGRTIDRDGQGLPTISEGLNSVRTYSFECHFDLPDKVKQGGGDPFLTLAAKQISNIGMTAEDIEVHRVNDRVFYPGKVTPDEVTITFDNLYQKKVSNTLWNWFKSIYNPLTGELMENISTSLGTEPRGDFKARELKLYHLDPHGKPLMTTKLFGVYPKSWKTAEFNYSNNDFHTIEMSFRFDFMDHGTSKPARAL